MTSAQESKLKNERLYREVRYARNTCLSMSNPAKFFKLKQNAKNLESQDYATCLIAYFDTSTSLGKLTLPDLQNVLGSIQSLMFGPVISSNSYSIQESTLLLYGTTEVTCGN